MKNDLITRIPTTKKKKKKKRKEMSNLADSAGKRPLCNCQNLRSLSSHLKN